jgi:hypothetical protein
MQMPTLMNVAGSYSRAQWNRRDRRNPSEASRSSKPTHSGGAASCSDLVAEADSSFLCVFHNAVTAKRSFDVSKSNTRLTLRGTFGAFEAETAVSFLIPIRRISYLVDSASSHMLVSKIKPCMSKYTQIIL